MNILFVYERMIIPTFGGVERVTYLLANELKKRGHQICFLSIGPLEWNQRKEDFGFEQLYIPFKSADYEVQLRCLISNKKISSIIFQGFHPYIVSSLPLVPKWVKKIIASHNKPFSYYPNERYINKITPWNKLPFKGKIYKILALVSPYTFRIINNRRVKAMYEKILSDTQHLVFLSQRFIPLVKSLIPEVEEEKLYAINNPNTFSTPQNVNNYKDKENIILFVGRISNPQKNVTGFIDIWKKFHSSYPEWKAMIVGDGEDMDFIEAYATKKKVRNLTFEGNQKNIEKYYRKAKILCMTSTYEGWPMVLAEAMAYDCVPIAFDSFQAVRDLIESGENGILVPPFSKDGMIAALKELSGNEVLRNKMASRGKEKIKEFTVERIVDQWERLLKIQ